MLQCSYNWAITDLTPLLKLGRALGNRAEAGGNVSRVIGTNLAEITQLNLFISICLILMGKLILSLPIQSCIHPGLYRTDESFYVFSASSLDCFFSHVMVPFSGIVDCRCTSLLLLK